MIIITAIMFKRYSVIIIIVITYYVFIMLSQNGKQLNTNGDFQNVWVESHTVWEMFYLVVWKSQLASSVLDSCKKFKYQD